MIGWLWLRPGFKSGQELEAFFARCDERERGREPEWEQHLEVINRFREGERSGT